MSYLIGFLGAAAPIALNAAILLVIAHRTSAD
jgi:hypothetical protein